MIESPLLPSGQIGHLGNVPTVISRAKMLRRRIMLSATAGAVSSLLSGSVLSHRKERALSHSAAVEPAAALIAPRKKWLNFSYVPHPAFGTPMAKWPGMITSRNSVWVRMHSADRPTGASEEWSLQVNGTRPLTRTLTQLRTEFRSVEIETRCRSEHRPDRPIFEFGCRLKGVWLKDVLAASGVPGSVQGIGNLAERPGEPFAFSSVFWLDETDDTDPILAYEINGSPMGSHSASPVHLFMPIIPGLYEM